MLRIHPYFAVALMAAGLIGCSSDSSTNDGGADAIAGIDAVVDAGADLVDAAVPTAVEHSGVKAEQSLHSVVLASDELAVRFDLQSGLLDITGSDGTAYLLGAEARAIARAAGEATDSAWGTSSAGSRSWKARALDDPLGSGLQLVITHEPEDRSAPVLQLSLDLRAQVRFVTARLRASWPEPPAGLRVSSLSPLVADTNTGGGLFLGSDPSKHRALNNGFDLYMDFEAEVHPVGSNSSVHFRPGSNSNWNLALFDPDTDKSLVAGFLSTDRAAGIIAFDYDAAKATTDDGRKGFTRFDGLSHYMEGRQLDESALLESELFYLELEPPTVFDGLEGFARRYAKRIGKKVWTDIPSGWNSWGGGGGSGGLGTNIDEALILANLDAAASDFLPWGMKYFMIDDGWEVAVGDWATNAERFPSHDGLEGMAWIAKQIEAKGMIPGIWISPFNASANSKLVQEHPDWFAEKSVVGQIFIPQNDKILDLSRPEVLDWLEQLFVRLTKTWGYRWLKVDFSYYALFSKNLHDPKVTPTEAYVNAMKRIRQAIGPDVFLLNVAAVGLCFDVSDANRITLDNEPWWGDHDYLSGDQGFKVTYRTVAHRYYLNHNLWINHPDLLFYRDDFGLTAAEARTWTSVVALTGGIVKLGESYTNMHDHPEWRAMVTPLLPIYPRSGRPLDLFERSYPELWDLEASREDKDWHVVGLFNWGKNRDIGGQWEPERTRSFELRLERFGLDPQQTHLAFDAWEKTWRWIDDGVLDATLEPRTASVLVLRPKPTEPQIVFTSRHLLGGAVEVHDETWTAGSSTLSARIDTVPDVAVDVYIASDLGVASVEVPNTALGVTHETIDGLVKVMFTPSAAESTIKVTFVP